MSDKLGLKIEETQLTNRQNVMIREDDDDRRLAHAHDYYFIKRKYNVDFCFISNVLLIGALIRIF